jgi:mRNA interferase YafQ
MYNLVFTNQFQHDVKRLQKRGYAMDVLKEAIVTLETIGMLQNNYRPHRLSGNYLGYWEAHLKSDWLIVWKIIDREIWLTRTGTHSDLF